MSDADYMTGDYERTIEELRRLLANARERWYEAVQEADAARLEAERWKMLYEQARQRGNQWQKVAETLYCDFHDGGCPASEHNRKMQAEDDWPIGYSIDCDCGYDLYHEALNNE